MAESTDAPAPDREQDDARVRIRDADALLAMPAEDYMNEAQLEFFRARLLALRGGMGYSTSVVVPDPSEENPIENGDRAFLEEERAIAASLSEHNAVQGAAIEAALARIDDGSYGYCVETGDPIGLQRLLAYPTATYTVEVQERHERQRRLGEVPGGGTNDMASGI